MKFRRSSALILTGLACVVLPSCATIASKSVYPVAVESNPSGLQFVIKDGEGNVVSNGKTPQTVQLNAGAGYFKAATYTIQSKRGSKIVGETTLTASVDGWYFGNLLIGGIIGAIIVDPLTGAMYKLPDSVLISGNATAAKTSHSLTLASIDTLTSEQRATLVRL